MSSAAAAANAASTTTNIHALLKKTEHYDKDERYMATSDLCEVLKRTRGDCAGRAGMDASTERRICTAVLRLLHDKSNDVQAIAVKTLGVLLTTVQEEQVLEIADSLADQVLDASKSELRDVYAIGLRTLVQTIPPRMGDPTSQRLVGRLLEGIRGNEEEIVLSCLDILTDLLGRFGSTAVAMTRQHEPILQMCLHQIHSAETVVVRKRAGTTIGCLSVVLSDTLLVSMVERLLGQLLQNEQVYGRCVVLCCFENQP
jgi:cullin-associated NEDD8-dissociated protein 1